MASAIDCKRPFNVKVPHTARAVYRRGKLAGYVWPEDSPIIRVPKTRRQMAPKEPRWASCTVDGITISRNSRTMDEAKRTVRKAAKRRVERSSSDAVPQHYLD